MTPQNMLSPTKGIIFYSDNSIEEPIKSMVMESIERAGLPITSSFLQPGEHRCYGQMLKQIISCLERSREDYVFFCEHDVLYPQSHFDFTPPKDNIWYYNNNVWRWDYPHNRYITYDRLICLSGLCVHREFALKHFKARLEEIIKKGYNIYQGGEPRWVREMGYEPGTKKKKRGGFSDDDFEVWTSKEPIIDIRHNKTFSPRKINLLDFKHQPKGWREINERPKHSNTSAQGDVSG